MSVNVGVVKGQEVWSDYLPAIVISGLITLLLLWMAVVVLKRKKL
ncbi:hypothetical protein [Paenibacillus turicensis]|nr:hypothetical protein [Paenibacillus turicensis]